MQVLSVKMHISYRKGKKDMRINLSDSFLSRCAIYLILYIFQDEKSVLHVEEQSAQTIYDLYNKMKDLVPLYEGFLTYGGISIREIEAMTVGLYETLEEDVVGQSPSFISYAVQELDKLGIPVIMPGGALGCHVDAKQFLSHIPQTEYPAGALVAAFYIISGCRGMERGTISSIRDEQGNDILADLELMRLAFPRRVFTLSQVEYLIDRLNWLYQNRELVGGLRFVEEPPVLRFFTGRLEPVNNWPEKLVAKFKADFGDSL